MSEATHYTLVRLLKDAETTDGKTWYEAPINAYDSADLTTATTFTSLDEATAAAVRDLDVTQSIYSDVDPAQRRWRDYVGVIGHDGDPLNDAEEAEVNGWSAGWVTLEDGFVEGDYEGAEAGNAHGPVAQVAAPPANPEPVRTYMDVRFDVTDLNDNERASLCGHVSAQAEGTDYDEEHGDGYPSVEMEIEWNDVPDDERSRNEDHADNGAAMLALASGWGDNDLHTDISDALVNIRHFCVRAGIDIDGVWAKAEWAQDGDLEDGPEAKYDPTVALKHGHRF
jgi:hypothetical protein